MEIQLQTILQPDPEICVEEALYFHRKGEEICFDGYFNLFYIEKWKRYTRLEKLQLSIKTAGYQMLRLYHNRECVDEIKMEEAIHAYIVEFPWEKYTDGVFWFSLVPDEKCKMQQISGYYMGVCEKITHVAIGIDICTYRREEYVLRNLKVLCERVLQNEELQVSKALWGYIIDNGKTLDAYEPLQQYLKAWQERISVIPNKNAGGAGGFTRGMLEVLEDKEERQLTHVVLMDDDAVLEPDLFVRMYGFLCVVKPEWKDIILGGTMLREDKPYLLFASGETWSKGLIKNANKNLDVREYENATRENLITTKLEKTLYSGWWCCCYSLNVIREDNLPIPLFLHHDDIEFGLRNQENGIVFLNGISVWHRTPDSRVVGSNLYYDIRNDLIEITQQYSQKMAEKCIWRFFWKRLLIRLILNRKKEVSLVVRGAEDFLKGIDWLWKQDPEKLHLKISDVEEDGNWICWKKSGRVCLKLIKERKNAVLNYQNKTGLYTQKSAWMKYLSK